MTTITNTGITTTDLTVDTNTIKVDSTNNKVGIGETSPQGKLHIKSADAGTTAAAGADELVIEGSGNTGITIASGASSSGSIYFADSGSAYDGWINYSQTDRKLNFATATGTRMSIDSTGIITMPNQPAFHAGILSQGGFGAYLTNFVLHADTGNHFNASTGTFTAPVAGKYFFAAFFMTDNTASSIDYSLHVNGTDYHYMVPYQASGSVPNYNQAGGQCIVALSANDAVRIKNNNTALYGSGGSPGRHSGFSGFLIG